jgi:FkbM family methyltransferase
MTSANHTAKVDASDQQFLEAARSSIKNFAFERSPVKNKNFNLKVAGHTASAGMRLKEWKPFQSKEWRMAPYEGPVIAVTDFLIRQFNVRTVYDVGAGGGFHTLMAATVEGHETVVHAFEMQPIPNSHIVSMAENVVEVRGRVFAHLAGLSDHHEGERTIWYTRKTLYEQKPDPKKARDALHRRIKFWLLGRENKGNLREATVLVTTMDRFARDNNAWPDLIKLDVDGYEAKVIPGALETLARKPFVIFELHKDELLSRFGVTRTEVVAPLFEMGYRAALFTDHNSHLSCDLVSVDRDDPSFQRQATTMYLFY